MTIVPYKEFIELAGAAEIPEDLGRFDKAITEAQKAKLRKRGIGTTGIDSSRKADRILCVADYRFKRGLATPGQMRTLRKLGVPDIGKKTFAEATAIIGNSAHW